MTDSNTDDAGGTSGTGDNGGARESADTGDQRGFSNDFIEQQEMKLQTVTTDAVAGETVLPGPGDGNDGPTGGATREGSPLLNEPEEGVDDLRDEDDE